MVFADELDIHLWPKGGYAWTPKGTQLAVMTPGQNQKHYLAGALDLETGMLRHCLGPRKTHGLFRDLLQTLGGCSIRSPSTRGIYVVVDHYKIHKAKAVEAWLAKHPRVTLLFLPTFLPPRQSLSSAPLAMCMIAALAIISGTRLPDLVANVEDHLHLNGPWKYQLSDLYYEPAGPAVVEKIAAEKRVQVVA